MLRLNPQRLQKILLATGWETLESGSLNLYVDNSVVDELLQYKPALEEMAASIKYPYPYEHIPALRKKYLYCLAQSSVAGKKQIVLLRRAECPPYKGLIEVFSPVNLRALFGLMEGNSITIKIDDKTAKVAPARTSS